MGQNFLDMSQRGDEKIQTRLWGGAENFRPSSFSKSLGRLKGYVKIFCANKVIWRVIRMSGAVPPIP